MTSALLRKELRQHWPALLIVLAFGAICFCLVIATTLARDSTETPFEAVRIFTFVIALLGAAVMNHRLVVLEYQARTQLFLEALPVARWRMVMVKYFLGLGTLLLLVGAVFAAACLLGWRSEDLTGRWAAIMLTRSFTVAWAIHSFFFLMGLTGRYRFIIYLFLVMSIAMLAEHKAVRWDQIGLISLVDTRFAYERELVPWQALTQTWAFAAAFTLLAAGLSLLREGSIAALLAEKMSHREKVLLAALFFGLIFAGVTLSEKTRKQPFDLQGAATHREAGVNVKVASGGSESDPAAMALARSVAVELSEMRDYLAIKELPPVFIVLRRDLDANRFERGTLAEAEGVHVRANFNAKDWQERDFIAWLVPQVLTVWTKSRVELESRRWVLDGFGLFWVSRKQPTTEVSLTLRSLYGTTDGLSAEDLDQWLRFREEVGEEVAAGVAWSGLRILERMQGSESTRRFLRAIIGTKEGEDFRVLFRRKAWREHLQGRAGISPEAFMKSWTEDLGMARQRLSGELAALPRLTAMATFVPTSSNSRQGRFRLSIQPIPPTPVRISLVYQRLSVFDEEVALKELQQEQANYPQHNEIELPETFSRGQRVYWGFSVDVPEMGCAAVSGFQREEIP